MKHIFFLLTLTFAFGICTAQLPGLSRFGQGSSTPSSSSNNKSDTSKSKKDKALGFEHRINDSITISYKYFDSIRIAHLDSSINDFDKYFSLPSQYQYMGNNGSAAYSLVYTPSLKPGWDAGFHAFDVYRFTLGDTKFYKTTKPFTQLGYMLATGKEMMVKATHTQNPKPNFNFGFDYRLIASPGIFASQTANIKNYRLFANYQSKKKRYAATAVIVGNAIKSSENGGIITNSSLSDPATIRARFHVPVNIGNGNPFSGNPLNTTVYCGNTYKDFTFFLRQSYDIGKKDSIAVNDSTTEYLFYPKLRFQHSFTYSSYNYSFSDYANPLSSNQFGNPPAIDSAYFKNFYDTTVKAAFDTLLLIREKWNVVSNDFSLLQFPDTKNTNQFLLAGVRLENIQGKFYRTDSTYDSKNFYNIVLHGEYRNKTRDKQWDLIAKSEFYLNGLNAGDYSIYAAINRHLNKKLGDINLYFTNVNQSPSFIFNSLSAFNFKNKSISQKQNIISFGANAQNPFFTAGFKNYFITNYAYFSDYYHTAQSNKIINLLQLFASKKIKLTKKINWYATVVLQQTDGSAPIKVPLLYTRNRLAFEGVFYKNLNLSTGLEIKYYTPYKAYNYSPVMGQFAPQDSIKLNNLPTVNAFLDFRIRSFTAYLRTENLNTFDFSNSLTFTNNNFAAPHYPTQGLIIRFGILWNFIL